MDINMDLGPLWQQLASWQNLIVVLACGGVMEAFKRGPLTSNFATSHWGGVLEFYAPVAWCWLALLLPVGLAPKDAGLGEKIMLGIILGMAADSVHDWVVKALTRLLQSAPSPAPLALPNEKK